MYCLFFFQAEDGIRDKLVTGVQTCALPIYVRGAARPRRPRAGARDQRAATVLGRQALVGRLGDLVRGGSGASDPAGIPALISAAIRTALFALLFMGSVLVYIPYLLAAGGATGGWHFGAWRYLGLLPLGAGLAGLAWCLRDFAVVGRGTPAPFDPPRELVATGLYRWVRNPMYLDRKSVV